MSETLIPTGAMRWFVDYDGERVLQQLFRRPSGEDVWKPVPTVHFYEEKANSASWRGM